MTGLRSLDVPQTEYNSIFGAL